MTQPLPQSDPELETLLASEPELLEIANTLRATRHQPPLDHRFHTVLRAQLMDASRAELHPGRGLSFFGLRPRHMAVGFGAFGTAAIAAALVIVVTGHPSDRYQGPPMATSSIAGNASVNPDDVITVAFDQQMNHVAVERALLIEPATRYSTSWTGEKLTITPAHHLAVNTPYTVTIAHTVARTVSGRAPESDIKISFGTKTGAVPTPAGPAPPPVIALNALGDTDPGATAVFAQDGSVYVTSATTPSPPTPSSAAPPSDSSSPRASASAGSGTGAAPTQAASSMLRIDPKSGGSTVIGLAAASVALSPAGDRLALVIPESTGARVMVGNADGTHLTRLTLTDLASSPITWSGNDAIELVADGRVQSLDLLGNRHALSPTPIAPSRPVIFAPGGHAAFVGPAPLTGTSASPTATSSTATGSTDGTLLDLITSAGRPLTGSRDVAAFSADGNTVAWLDRSGPAARVRVGGTGAGGADSIVDAGSTGAGVTGLALSPDGSKLAEVTASAVVVRTVSTGTEVAEAAGGALSVAWNAEGSAIAVIRHGKSGNELAVGSIPGIPSPVAPPASDGVATDAVNVINAFVAAQIAHDGRALSAVASPLIRVADVLPKGVTRGYVIAMNSEGADTVTASVRLIADASGGAPPSSAAETVTVAKNDGPYAVTTAHLATLAPIPTGPQVIHVTQSTSGPAPTFQLTFDSDLDPATLPGAVSLRTSAGSAVEATVRYDAATRTVIITAPRTAKGILHLRVTTSLQDVAGQQLPASYESAGAG